MQIKFIKRLTYAHKHHAFTDLCDFRGALYCCYRVASNHVSGDGVINIVTMTTNTEVKYTQRISLPSTDLRDPKLSITPKGELMLLAYARRSASSHHLGLLGENTPVIWTSQDGLSWSSPTNIGEKHWWLWRLRWHNNSAYGLAYNRSANAVHLYSGQPKQSFHRVKNNVFSLKTHNRGYPNESDMCFTDNGTAYVILRRDSDTYSAQLGVSKAPYTQWHWTDLGFYLGGPNMLKLDEQSALLAGRVLYKNKLVTAVLKIEFKSAKVRPLKILPSSGDNSYPGMVRRGNTLFVSYYSAHQDQQAHIYLAALTL
jgi:hypothetical protein